MELHSIQIRNESATQEFDRISKEIADSENSLKKANAQQLILIKKLEKFSKSSEQILNRKAILTNRREEIHKKIKELGVLPEEASFSGVELRSIQLRSIVRKVEQSQ